MRAANVAFFGLSLLAFAQVASCAATMTAAPAKPLPVPVVAVACPPLKDYTAGQSRAMGYALAALPPDNPLVSAMADYGQLREAARACRG